MSSLNLSVPLVSLALLLLPVVPVEAAECATSGEGIVCTEHGAVRGVVEGETIAFKGIPYAAPPVGDLRWRPPATAKSWDGVRDGSRFGSMCPQLVGKEVRGDEDCLTINVWTPRSRPATPWPVMIWLTGGGNHSQSGEGSGGFGGVRYNGQNFVPNGAVFVSYNLRLGALGFLAHPALDAERPEKISGNYGSLDQVAMLQWVKRNIAAFGGDPNRVFLFGTSAGGGNICALMTSPLTRGLIHGVAMQSSVPSGCEILTLADAQNGTGRRVTAGLGCDKTADVAACLRSRSVKEVVAAVPGTFTVSTRIYGPNMDGHVFPDQPLRLIAQGKVPAVPVIIGNTANETLGWVRSAGNVTDAASYAAAIDHLFGARARERILARYPATASPREAFIKLTTDAEFTCQSRRVARTFARVGKLPVYRFVFAHGLENNPQLKSLGANHTIEHAFLFGWQGKYQPTERERQLGHELVGYWTRTAKTGNPNDGRAPAWPAATADNDAYLEFGTTTAARNGPQDAQCDFWDTVPFNWPHL